MNETYVLSHHKSIEDVLTVHVVRQARMEEDEAKVEPSPHPPVLARSNLKKSVCWFRNNEEEPQLSVQPCWVLSWCPLATNSL